MFKWADIIFGFSRIFKYLQWFFMPTNKYLKIIRTVLLICLIITAITTIIIKLL